MSIVWWALLISVGLNVLLFIPAYLYKTDRLTDLSYSLTFIVVAITGFAHSNRYDAHVLVLFMVLLWSLRLGGYLFTRINRLKKDSRFDQRRQHFWSFFNFWLLQGVSVFIILAPALALWQVMFTSVNWLGYVGWVIFGLGLTLESVADYQKSKFNQTKTKSIWIDSGVWRISRHPNYLGEIMVWAGIYLFCFSNLSGLARAVTLVSPLYIFILLRFVSGVPLLEKSADKKWGKNKAYQTYKDEVPVLLPTPKSLQRLN